MIHKPQLCYLIISSFKLNSNFIFLFFLDFSSIKGKTKNVPLSADLENWMTNLPATLRNDVPIINLAIPGSHDSASYGINKKSKIAPDSEKIIKIIFPFVPCVVKRWAKTQEYSAMEQCEAGIR